MSVGVWQLVLILLIVLVLFGAGRLPQVAADIGKSLGVLRRSIGGSDAKRAESETDVEKEEHF
jgi:sec-independent protein translocase protein TatA